MQKGIDRSITSERQRIAIKREGLVRCLQAAYRGRGERKLASMSQKPVRGGTGAGGGKKVQSGRKKVEDEREETLQAVVCEVTL